MSCRLALPPLACLAALAVSLWSSRALAKIVELKNDTLEPGGEVSAICGFALGEKFAARFVPPAYPAKLLKVRVFVINVELSLKECVTCPVAKDVPMPIEIFQKTTGVPGKLLLEEPNLAVSNESVLNEFDVSSQGLTISSGEYFVAFTLAGQLGSPVVDKSTPVPGGNYIHGDVGGGSDWFSFEQLGAAGPKGNWVVRVDVEIPGDDPDAGQLDASTDAVSEAGSGGTGGGGSGGSATAGAGASAASDAGSDANTTAGVGGTAPAAASQSDSGDDGGCGIGARSAQMTPWIVAAAAGLLRVARKRREAGPRP